MADIDDFVNQYRPKAPAQAPQAGSPAAGGIDDFVNQYRPANPVDGGSASPGTAAAAQQPGATATPAQPQTSGWQRVAQMGRNAITQGLAEGADALEGPIQSWAQHLAKSMPGLAAKLPSGPDVGGAGNYQDIAQQNLVNPGANVPQTAGERYATEGLKGAASALPLALTGGSALGGAVVGAMGAEGAQAAGDLFPNQPWLKPVAGVAAGGLGALGQHLVEHTALEGVADRLGDANTVQEGGAKIQAAAKDWLESDTNPNGLKAQEARVWQPLDDVMHGPNQPFGGPDTPLTAYSAALNQITGKGGSLAGQMKVVAPTGPAALKRDLDDMMANGGTPSWQDVRDLRSAMGQLTGTEAKQIGQANVDKLYAALTDDLSRTARMHGAGELFDQANATSSQLRTMADQHIRPLVEDGVPAQKAAELALQRSQGGERLAALNSAIPDAVKELAAGKITADPRGYARLPEEAQHELVRDPQLKIHIDNAVGDATGHNAVGSLGHTVVAGETGASLGVLAGEGIGLPWEQAGSMGQLAGLAARVGLPALGSLASRPQLLRPIGQGWVGSGSDVPPLHLNLNR